MQNKPNFSPFFNQKQRFHKKTNPIQTQFQRITMKAHAWKMNHTIILIVFLADFTNLKVANFKSKTWGGTMPRRTKPRPEI